MILRACFSTSFPRPASSSFSANCCAFFRSVSLVDRCVCLPSGRVMQANQNGDLGCFRIEAIRDGNNVVTITLTANKNVECFLTKESQCCGTAYIHRGFESPPSAVDFLVLIVLPCQAVASRRLVLLL